MPRIEVSIFYACDAEFHRDAEAIRAAGRKPDSSGWGMGERDLGWTCKSKSEAKEIILALEGRGWDVDVRGAVL